MKDLVIGIRNALNESKPETEILIDIKKLVAEEIRQQSLKATPGHYKLSSVLTKMYNSAARGCQGKFFGYVPMSNRRFAITNSHWCIRVTGNVSELLPVDALPLECVNAYQVDRLFKGIDLSTRDDLVIHYADVVQHIKTYGRKKTGDGVYFTVPGTKHMVNVFYLEYAFKLVASAEITFKVRTDRQQPWYLKGKNWEMVLQPIHNPNFGAK